MAFYFASEVNKRSANEDSYCNIELRVNHEASVSAMVVADGMGGLSGGKYYSEAAVKLWYEALLKTIMGDGFKDCSLSQQIETLWEFAQGIFETINSALYRKGLDAGVKGGTTLTCAIHFWDIWIVANCGDSPAYCMKNGTLSLVSEIQNVASQMVRSGKAKEGTALYYQNKNRLLEYLGKREEVHPYCVKLQDKSVDSLLLGSDGAFGNLSIQKIEELMNRQEDRQKLLFDLFEQSRESGEEDNQTAVLFEKEEEISLELFQTDLYQNIKPDDMFQNAVVPFCCYTEVEKERKNVSLREKLRMNRWMGGKEK